VSDRLELIGRDAGFRGMTQRQENARRRCMSQGGLCPRRIEMSNKLFVGGLSWNTTDEGLRDAFSQFGDIVEAKVVNDRETGRSRGFGFVTMATAANADEAMRALDGSSLDGRSIRVNAAASNSSRDRR
jgi:RNA recognition motif-containing protein